jgi:hypothetical protein
MNTQSFYHVMYNWDAMVFKNARVALDAIESNKGWRPMQAVGRDAVLAWGSLKLPTVSLAIGD